MKLISWNVNGLRACIGKGFLDFVNFIDAERHLPTGDEAAAASDRT